MKRNKYSCIFERWMTDSKWKNERPFMLGNLLCWETVKGTGKNAIYEHHYYDTTDKTVNHLICEQIPKEAIEMYKFLNNI